MAEDSVVSVRNLTKSYGGKVVLKGVSMVVRRGEIVAVIGGSGSGKSTLLRHLLGLEQPEGGTIELFGRDIQTLTDQQWEELRRRFGILFQSGALFGSMTVGENVALPLEEHTDLSKEVREILVRMKLDVVGLAHCIDLMPSELSGGMRKRAGLARAIALDPELMFYDEPQSGLDPVLSAVIDKLIVDLNTHLGITSVVVTHSMQSALRLADRLYMLHRGEVVTSGTPQELQESTDERVRQFVFGLLEGPLAEATSRESVFSPQKVLAQQEEREPATTHGGRTW